MTVTAYLARRLDDPCRSRSVSGSGWGGRNITDPTYPEGKSMSITTQRKHGDG